MTLKQFFGNRLQGASVATAVPFLMSHRSGGRAVRGRAASLGRSPFEQRRDMVADRRAELHEGRAAAIDARLVQIGCADAERLRGNFDVNVFWGLCSH